MAVYDKAHKERFLDIVENDAKIKGKLLDKKGNTCQVGAMLIAIGVSPAVGQKRPDPSDYIALYKHFGVSFSEVAEIMSCNDLHRLRKNRQAALRKLADVIWIDKEEEVLT